MTVFLFSPQSNHEVELSSSSSPPPPLPLLLPHHVGWRIQDLRLQCAAIQLCESIKLQSATHCDAGRTHTHTLSAAVTFHLKQKVDLYYILHYIDP